MPASFPIVLTGSRFVSSSVGVFNGNTVTTAVNNSSKLTITVTSSMIAGPGAYNVPSTNPRR